MNQVLFCSVFLLAKQAYSSEGAYFQTLDSFATAKNDSTEADINVDISEYPHQVAIVRDYQDTDGTKSYLLLCTGTILTAKFVLTAASCFDSVVLRWNVWVHAGSTTYNNTVRFQEVLVSRVYKHHLHDVVPLDYDIAVIELFSELRFNPNVLPAFLPPVGPAWKTHMEVTVVGWGSQEPIYRYLVNLRASDMLLSDALCLSLLDRDFSDRMMCTGLKQFRDWSSDQCAGTVGAALVVKEATFVVIGIMILGDCTSCPFTNVYTRLANKEIHDFIIRMVYPSQRNDVLSILSE